MGEHMTATALASRYGVDPGRVESLRLSGDLVALRDESGEWLYPAGQFAADGVLRAAVRRVVRAANDAGLSFRELGDLLGLRAGAAGGRTLGELIASREEIVTAQIRLRGRLAGSFA